MNVSLNWLKYYVDIDLTPQQLADKLTLAGIAVENIIYLGQGLEGVVTGKVVEISKHPEADKLWICKIDIGQPETLQIVTGADNVRQDYVVPVAVVGSRLPNGMKMKAAKLRGVESAGMLCSSSELNLDNKTLLPEQREGIFILDADTPIGKDIKEILGLDDVILEFELTANRADCFGIIGIAREVASVTGAQLKNIPQMPTDVKLIADSDKLHIKIENSELCGRFTGRLLEGIKLGPSPYWLQKILRAMGMRPISNIVDVTNFVMLELCQPMHAYDAATLKGNLLMARQAHTGEKLVTLDDQLRELTPDMLVIADTANAVGLAGVMGGLATEVTAATVDIILEAASFNGVSVRKTSRALGLRSEASSRFERGVDIDNTQLAICRATQLLQDITTVEKAHDLVDCYPIPKPATQIALSIAHLNRHLGTDLTAQTMTDILERLSFGVLVNGDTMIVDVPSWRSDVTTMVDISEEIARNVGFDNIQSSMPADEMTAAEQTPIIPVNDDVRDFMVAAGLDEVINYSFINSSAFDKLNLPADDALRTTIDISNPITDEFKVLRTTLLSSILSTVSYNISRRNENISIFEVGNAYLSKQVPITDFPTEVPMLAGAISGKRNEVHWSNDKSDVDFFDVKGLMIDLLNKFSLHNYQLVPSKCSSLHPGKSADIMLDGQCIGYFGQVHPLVEQAYDFTKPVYAFELQLKPLIATYNSIAKYQPLPKYPFITRDLAVLMPNDISMQQLQEVVEQSAGQYLSNFKLFDVYQGKQVAEGHKSIAFTITFQANDRTLTDKEVEDFTKNILDSMQSKFNLKLRS